MQHNNADTPTEAGIDLICGDPTRLEELRALARDIQAGRVGLYTDGTEYKTRCLILVSGTGSVAEQDAALQALVEADERFQDGRHQALVVTGDMLDRRMDVVLAERAPNPMVLVAPPRDDYFDLRVERMKPDRPWEENRRTRMGRTRAARRTKRGK